MSLLALSVKSRTIFRQNIAVGPDPRSGLITGESPSSSLAAFVQMIGVCVFQILSMISFANELYANRVERALRRRLRELCG